jgi:hypothetical protein
MARYRRVILDVEVGTEPIAGRVRGERGDSESFAGWLELAAAVERARRPGEDASQSGTLPVATTASRAPHASEGG